jgi:hypothetical protein
MTTFSHIFRETRDLAISQGRRPVVCLLGPDVQDDFYRFTAEEHWEWWPVQPSYTQKLHIVSATEDLGVYSGVRIRRMTHPGLAIITTPAPESGFDTTN